MIPFFPNDNVEHITTATMTAAGIEDILAALLYTGWLYLYIIYTYVYLHMHMYTQTHKHTLYTGKGKMTNIQETEKTNRIKDMT